MALNFPQNPTIGQVYTVNGESWKWDGHCWGVAAEADTYAPVFIGQFPPPSPIAGDLWWNSTSGKLCIYYVDTDSAQWVAATQVPEVIATVDPAQVTSAFLEELAPHADITAAATAGVNTGQLFKITGGTTVDAIRAVSSYDSGGGSTTVASLVTLSGVPADSLDLGTFTGTTIADNSTVKGALQQLETKTETAVFGAAGNPTEIQFNQAGAFTGSADLTFNTGTKELTVAGPIVSDSVTGTDTAFKTETGGVAFTTILNDGTASFAGEVTTSNRITHQRASASSVAVRFSPDSGSTFPATIEAGGKANLPYVNFNINYANKAAAGAGALGDTAVIGGLLCFHDGTDWKEITLGSAPA